MKYAIALETTETIYWLSKKIENAAISVLGSGYKWQKKKKGRRLFKTKADANKTLKDMHNHNTGRNAYIVEIQGN